MISEKKPRKIKVIKPLEGRKTFTTGQVAQVMDVSIQTVIRLVDDGKLKGFKIPGSRFRRISRDSLVAFMKDNNIPMPAFLNVLAAEPVSDDEPSE